MFQGNLGDNSRKHHTFTTINSDFEAASLNQFTLSYLYYFCKGNHSEIKKLNLITSTIKTFLLSAKERDEDAFISSFFSNIDSAYYYKFDKTVGRFIKTAFEVSKILSTITEFEKIKTQKNYKNNSILQTVRNIQLSSDGYLLLKSNISITVGETQIPIEFKLYFKDNIDTFTGARKMVSNTSNKFSGIPTRTTGGVWGASSTNNIENKQENIGVYASPSSPNSPIEQKVGELAMSWNSNTGKWEAGTQQIMAKLLTNIDKAPIKNVSIQPTDTANGKRFYDQSSDYYMGAFTTGLAIPLSVEKGNPYLFGPNCLQCTGGEQKIEKIRVVNRAPRSFKKGATVLCSRIDGEWIIQDFGFNPDDVAPLTSIGEWSFIKLIANSDDYFKDNRYVVANGRDVTIDQTLKQNISPNSYETKTRNRFYAHLSAIAGGDIVPPITDAEMLSDIKSIYPNILSQVGLQKTIRYNGFPSISGKLIDSKPDLYSIKTDAYNFEPNTKYFISTVFDQLGPQMGGNSPENFIARTNISNTTAVVDNRRNAIPFSFFWGPVFPDGYKNEDVTRVSLYSDRLEDELRFVTNNQSYFTGGNNVNPFSINSAFLTNYDLYSNDTVNAKEIPAEVGVLSSGNGIEDITQIMKYSSNKNFIEHTRGILNSNRFAYLLDSENAEVYDMQPISPNKIQFTPLHAEFAAHADQYSIYTTTYSKSWDRDFFNNTRSLLKTTYANIPHFWGKMFSRFVGPVSYYKNPSFPQTQKDGLDDPSFIYDQSKNGIIHEFDNVPYDYYINSTPTSKPKGITRLFHDNNSDFQGANLVGVIAAKNKFTKNGGGKINYSVEQFFGLRGDVSNATTGSDSIQYNNIGLGILAVVNALTGQTPLSRDKAGFATWGSDNSDKYDSFGTTALHVRVFDAWPNEQTIYDARYYAILHFNPGTILSIPESETVGDNVDTLTTKFGKQYSEWDTNGSSNYRKVSPATFNYSRSVDKIKYDVDFRIPTYAWPLTDGDDNKVIPVYTNIDKDTLLRPKEEWRVNPIRRGQLLTGGGFRYLQNVIGLSYEDHKIASGGKGFVKDKKYTISNSNSDIVIVVTDIGNDGSIKEFEFVIDEDNNELRGTGFLPSDFASESTINDVKYTGFLLTIPNSSGEEAEIVFPMGRVYQLLLRDDGPKERTASKAPILLTSPSEDGRAVVEGTQTSSVDIEANSDGQYDAFYFFHNDITHTPTIYRNDTYSVGIEQYITVTIT
jgi:hypothetical protein